MTVQATLPAAGREAQLTLARASGMTDEDLAAWADRIRSGLAMPDLPTEWPAEGDEPIDLDETQLTLLDGADDGQDEALAAFLKGRPS